MPGVEFVDPVIELLGVIALHVQVAAHLPAHIRIGVLIGEAQRAAAAHERGKRKNGPQLEKTYQKLSTVIWPGTRRRCLRRPRSASAAEASLSISGLPHSITWERSSTARAAAASSLPSRIAAGMRPASDPAAASRLTNVT